MQKILFLIVLISAFLIKLNSQNNFPYPVIFVHGLAGSDETFGETMIYLRNHDALGDINIFDVVLNADNNTDYALISSDVKWTDFLYSGDFINVGRRNYTSDIDDFVDGWTGTNLFAINFKEERIRGAVGFWNDYFDQSNESGIFKQGYALGKMIQEVLNYTGANKVVLVGHSMGGLCIREYLQRTNSSGIHTNWVNPYVTDGHCVARVATYGTPHLGSNTSPDPTKASTEKSDVPSITGNSEANRDLLWEYDDYTNCGGTPQGIYLFGGNEHCIESVWYNGTFDNVDINCDGDQSDNIIGINESYYTYNYNASMPLPLNIKYTYMTSIWTDWGGSLIGDGAVNIERQWLHNGNTPTPVGLTDTTLSDIFHTDEGSDYKNIIRGIDEPEFFNLAYDLKLNMPIIGYITFQQNFLTADVDIFKINSTGLNNLVVQIDGALSGVHTIEFYDENFQLTNSRNLSTFPNQLYANNFQNSNIMYLKISGSASDNTWRNPYKITIHSGSWEGDISSDWNLSSNWLAGVPDANDDVYISENVPNMPLVNTDVLCNRMNIEEQSVLTINPEASVSFLNNLILNGQIILKTDETNTATYTDNGYIEGNGQVVLERWLKSGGYHYLSTHVDNGNTNVFTNLLNGSVNPNLYLYDETVNQIDWLEGWISYNGIMDKAKGYAYYAPYEQSIYNLSGKPNTGNISIPVTNSQFGISSDGWNLIGNPYPSSVSAFDFINLNNSGIINGAIYLWDDDYSQYYEWEDYGVFNLSGYVDGSGGYKVFDGYIAPGQGFFVKALNSGNVFFNNSVRRNSESIFFKKAEENIKRMYLNMQGNGFTNNILITFTESASNDYDFLYDAEKINTKEFAFYSLLNNEEMIIQAFNNTKGFDNEIMLGTEIPNSGYYTFSLYRTENFETEIPYLKDKFLNVFKNLNTGNYEVFLDKGVFNNRFSIVFEKQVSATDDVNDSEAVKIYSFNNYVFINDPFKVFEEAFVYNLNGQMICRFSLNNISEYNLDFLNSGIYFLKLVSNKKVASKKIIIN